MNIKDRKYINNLPKFDIGKNQIISTGRQSTTSVDTSKFSATGGYTGYNNEANTYDRSIFPQTLSTLTNTASTLGTMVSNFTTQSAAASTNIATALSKGLVDTAGNFTPAGAAAAGSGAAAGRSAGAAGTEAALAGSGNSVASAGLSATGIVTGIAGTAYGAYNMISGAQNYNNRLHDSDLLQGASRSTYTKYGRSYETIGGIDEQGALNLTSSQNSADNTNMAMSGLSTGVSAGATIGSIIPGLGTIAGGLIGGLIGGIGGSMWGKSEARKRYERVQQDIANSKISIEGRNLMAESEAASQGLRDMYNASRGSSTTGILRADKGKNIGDIKEGSYGKIETERGTEYGPIQGIAQPREGIVNYDVPYTHYLGSTNPNVKEPRIDNIPVGSNFDFGKDFILGNKPYEGKKGNPTYADLGRNALKQNEVINQKREAGQATPEDEQTYMKNWKYLRSLGESQMRSTNGKSLLADKGKNVRKYSFGGWLKNNSREFSPLVGLAARLPYAIAEQRAANAEEPYAQNSFVPNATANSALNILGNLRYDPSAQLAEMIRVAGQNRYNINTAGNLSAGQRAALSTSANNQLFSQRGAILADAYNKNAAYKQAYANALMQHGQSEATRAQQALATQQEQYRQAVGAKQKWQEQARKNWYTIAGQTLQDWSTNSYQNKMLDLWNKQAETDRLAVTGGKSSKSNKKNVKYGDVLPVYMNYSKQYDNLLA